MYRQANESICSNGVTARGATFKAGRIDSNARFRPATDSRKVWEWLRRQAIASITTMIVALVINSGASAIKC
ncbi:hypothetical protein D3C81_1433920 [compost metagenome]